MYKHFLRPRKETLTPSSWPRASRPMTLRPCWVETWSWMRTGWGPMDPCFSWGKTLGEIFYRKFPLVQIFWILLSSTHFSIFEGCRWVTFMSWRSSPPTVVRMLVKRDVTVVYPRSGWSIMIVLHWVDCLYPLVICYIAIENGHLQWVLPIKHGDFP